MNNYRVPLNLTFSIKPSAIKKSRVTNNTSKCVNKVLYCVPYYDENGNWKARINTKGLENFQDITILDFTEKSLELKGKVDVFLHQKDNTGHWVHIMRDAMKAYIAPGVPELYTPLCEDSVFSGHIVKVNGIMQFDILNYKGSVGLYNEYMNRNNNKNYDECD